MTLVHAQLVSHPWLILGALMIAGWVAMSLASKRRLTRTINDLHVEMQARINVLTVMVRALQQPATEKTDATPMGGTQKTEAPDLPSSPAPRPEVAPQTIVMIAAAVTAFLGKKVRIRSARPLQRPLDLISPWAQQGRMVIQASHNLTHRHEWQ